MVILYQDLQDMEIIDMFLKVQKVSPQKSTTILSAVRQRFQDVLDISADLAMVPPWASWHPRKPARVDFPTKPVVLTFLSNAPETKGGQGIKCVNTVIYIYASSWWLNHPFEEYYSQIGSSPQGSGWK